MDSKELSIAAMQPPTYYLSRDEVTSLEAIGVIPPHTPAPVISMYARVCGETRMSPFKRQVYIVKRRQKQGTDFVDRYQIQTGIDGFRAIAEETGQYAGSDDAIFVMDSDNKLPLSATVTVYKMVSGERCPFSATARWSEYYPGDAMGFMWRKMPFTMLAKCAEALALRKSFPARLSGLYTTEEMQQADREQAKPAPDVQPVETHAIQEAPAAAAEPAAEAPKHGLDIATREVKMLQAFRELGVGHNDIAAFLGHEIEHLTDDELHSLRVIFDKIKRGEAKWTDFLPPTDSCGASRSPQESQPQNQEGLNA